MTIPSLPAPKLLVFTEAAQVLLDSSQALLAAGHLEADLPLRIEEAVQKAQQQLQQRPELTFVETQPMIQSILRLTPPESVLALLRDLVDLGNGPDIEGFLEAVGDALTQLRFPKLLVCPVALEQLQQRMEFSVEEQEAIRHNLTALEQRLSQLVAAQQVDPTILRQATVDHLAQLATPDLMQLVQDYLAEEEEEEEGELDEGEETSFTVAGPLMFMEIVDYLLSHPESPLTPDQRLDLQRNRVKAEAKYRAMDKLGRIDNLAEQKQSIQTWRAQQSLLGLMQWLDHYFELDGESGSP